MSEDASDIAYHMPFLEECASRAGIIVEIGVGNGNGSTRAFARGLDRSPEIIKLHVGVDTDPERPQERPARFTAVYGPSEERETCEMVKAILDGDHPDIIFIDTIHTYEHMDMEMPIWQEISAIKTLWLFHDTWMFGVYNHMTEAIKDHMPEKGWEYLDHSRLAHGMGVLRHKDGPWGWIEQRVEADPIPQV